MKTESQAGIKLSDPQMFIAKSIRSVNLFMAGVGSGKTHLAGIISKGFIDSFPEVRGFIGANTYDQLTNSTMFRIREVWKDLGWIHGRDYVVGVKPPEWFDTSTHNFDRYTQIISFSNGAVVFKGSMDAGRSHEGKEFGWAILDETKDTKEETVKEVILNRLRQRVVINGLERNPLYILTSPAKVEWINKWFRLGDYESEIKDKIYSRTEAFLKRYDNKAVAISSTYHNARNLPPDYIKDKEIDLTEEQFKRLIYGDPFQKTGGEFYSGFDRFTHVGDYPFIEGHPIHISFDQNVVPYITMTIWQVRRKENGRYAARAIDELCLESPMNTTEKLCREFLRLYGTRLKDGLFFYGDATGKNRDTRGNENDYDIVERVLARHLSNTSHRVAYRNPPVIKRRDFINSAFEGRLQFDIEIDRKCKNLITDLEYLKEDPNGKKFKEKVKDSKSTSSYEKYGHTSDSMDYFLVEVFDDYFTAYAY